MTTTTRPLPEIAGLHEQTVRDAELHTASYARPARQSDPRRPRVGRVEHVRADNAVMAEALRLARGDARRLQVNKDGSVYVR
jgi:hypothetical protein